MNNFSEAKLNVMKAKISKVHNNNKLTELLPLIYQLFKFDFCGLEMHLKKDTSIDFAFMVCREKGLFNLPQRENFNTPSTFFSWQNYLKLVSALNVDEELFDINYLWLEFDFYENSKSDLYIPGVYVQIHPSNIPKLDKRIFKIVNLLISEPKNKQLFFFNLNETLEKASFNVNLIYLGMFFGRDNSKLRIAFFVLFNDVFDFLSRYKYNVELKHILLKLNEYCNGQTTIHLDVSSDNVFFQGIEIYADSKENWLKILEELTNNNLCDNYSIYNSINWVEQSIYEDIHSIQNILNNFNINHIKIVNAEPIYVKIYLNAYHKLL